MKTGTVLLALFGVMLALSLSITTPAQAQATRTWISGVGDDANPCSRTAPCKTFAGAISKTAAGGEIDCLDPGGFGAVTITKSIIFDCGSGETGQVGSILVSGTNGINVNAGANDVVILKKLSINGIGAGFNGISFSSGKSLLVDNVNIMGFQIGISITPSASASVFIADTNITDCQNAGNGAGIFAKPTGSVVQTVAIERSKLTNNDVGLQADGITSLPLKVSVSDSYSSGNLFAGIFAGDAASAGGQVNMMIRGTTSSNNGSFGVRSVNSATVFIGSSVISGNATGLQADSGAVLKTYSNNQVNQNSSVDIGAGVTTAGLQ